MNEDLQFDSDGYTVKDITFTNIEDLEQFAKDTGMRATFGGVSSDAIRYYLLSVKPIESDGNFSYEGLIDSYNANLVNKLGNLVSRTISMVIKFCDSKIPWIENPDSDDEISSLEKLCPIIRDSTISHIQNFQLNIALQEIFSLVTAANTYLERLAPFKLIKTNPARAKNVLYNVIETLRWIGILLLPFIPSRATLLLRQIQFKRDHYSLPTVFGELQPFQWIYDTEPLFPRITPERKEALINLYIGLKKR